MALQAVDGACVDIDGLYRRTICRERSQQTVQMTFGEGGIGELCRRGIAAELLAVTDDLYRRIGSDTSEVQQIGGITMV